MGDDPKLLVDRHNKQLSSQGVYHACKLGTADAASEVKLR